MKRCCAASVVVVVCIVSVGVLLILCQEVRAKRWTITLRLGQPESDGSEVAVDVPDCDAASGDDGCTNEALVEHVKKLPEFVTWNLPADIDLELW